MNRCQTTLINEMLIPQLALLPSSCTTAAKIHKYSKINIIEIDVDTFLM